VPLCQRLISPHSSDPIMRAFAIGTQIRWLDFNDTWLVAEWAHPSDNLGTILAVACSQNLTLEEILPALVKAYEIQGQLAILNSFNHVGLDHVILVKVASAAVAAQLLGGHSTEIHAALNHAWMDLGPLRTYRQGDQTGPRKSWAAGDATARGLWLATLVMRGEKSYPKALNAPRWGLYDALFEGKPFHLQNLLSSHIVENILFKVKYPAEFHAQTAIELATQFYPLTKPIASIEIETHEAALRIITKEGPLRNPADRDHCLQYMVATALLKGDLKASDYEDEAADHPLLDPLRAKMRIRENSTFTDAYLP